MSRPQSEKFHGLVSENREHNQAGFAFLHTV